VDSRQWPSAAIRPPSSAPGSRGYTWTSVLGTIRLRAGVPV